MKIKYIFCALLLGASITSTMFSAVEDDAKTALLDFVTALQRHHKFLTNHPYVSEYSLKVPTGEVGGLVVGGLKENIKKEYSAIIKSLAEALQNVIDFRVTDNVDFKTLNLKPYTK